MGRKKKAEQQQRAYFFKKNRYVPQEVKEVGAQVIGEAIEKAMDSATGIVNKGVLVEQARPEVAPLHSCFEWHDKTAAGKYREHQARNIVNVVDVQVTSDRRAPAFPSVILPVAVRAAGEAPQRENVRMQNVLADPAMRQQLINQVLAKLIRLREEYRAINELAIVWDAVDQASETPMVSA